MTWIDQILKINNRTEIETTILNETDKAVQVDNVGRKVWLPKKLIKIKPIENNRVKISFPKWLFEKKFV